MDKLREAIINNDIWEEVKNEEIGSRIVFLDSIDSTNFKAKELASKGYQSGTVVVADEQTAGRGRLGRNWYSPAGTGLWLSIILRPDIPPLDSPLLTVIASLAVYESLLVLEKEPAAPEQHNNTLQIKWPNDILMDGKKLAGILTELSLGSKINYAVVGIGINVNQEEFPAELSGIATSLRREYNKEIDRLELFKKILISFERYYFRLLNNDGPQLVKEWKGRMNIIGKEVSIHDNERIYQGRVLDIAEQGELILESGGEIFHFWAGDVSLRSSPAG
ncbi:MAG: biotin--[acetyl-CoA-carboxylase] ligase [Halanaerobiales bacterium]